jgi:hypothetical protein
VYATTVNYFIPRQTVVLYSGASNRRYQTVYSRNLKIHKGVDNKLQFQFLNQDQKPVNITGKTLTCRLMSYDGSQVLLQKSLTPLLPLTGLATLEVTSNETLGMNAALCYYSLSIPEGTFEYPVFVDDNSGGRGVVEVTNSILPKFVKSAWLGTLPHVVPTVEMPVTYYSEKYTGKDASNYTVQVGFTGYIGTVKIQGSVSGAADEWYDITESVVYNSHYGTEYYNLDGCHVFLRIEFASSGGTIGKILFR